MYCVELKIQPTAAMTFRILPGSILNIATYPFVPPTTLSGFLRRLCMIGVGLEVPDTRVNNENPPIYALPPRYQALGAYPVLGKWSGVHRTYRKGTFSFNHDAFSSIYREKKSEDDKKKKEEIQLHTWEYLIVEELAGYVISEFQEGLEHFQKLPGYGCKFGKEGFGFISEVSDIIKLRQETATKNPSTIVPMETLLQSNQFVSGCDIYNLYHYKWAKDAHNQSEQIGFLDNQPTKVEGFIPFVAAYFAQETSNAPTLDYYTDGKDINIPISLINLLRGDYV